MVPPEQLPNGEPVGELLGNLITLARRTPAAGSTCARSPWRSCRGGSLLLVLATRSLQLALADIGRDNLGVTTPDLEPIAADQASDTLLSEQVRAVRPGDLTGPTPAAQAYRRVAGALKAAATIPVEEVERLLPATIDCAAQRVDAWSAGPPQRRLAGCSAAPLRPPTTAWAPTGGWTSPGRAIQARPAVGCCTPRLRARRSPPRSSVTEP